MPHGPDPPTPGRRPDVTTRVTAVDAETGESETDEITDNYVLIREGTCRVTNIQRHANGTHVITVKGCG
jgi:hypothetical protein